MSDKINLKKKHKNNARQPVAVNIADLNNMLVIIKKHPPRTYKEKIAYRAEKQRQQLIKKV